MLNDDDGGSFIVDLSVVFGVKFEGSAAAWALAGSFAYRQPCDLRLLARLHFCIIIVVPNRDGRRSTPIASWLTTATDQALQFEMIVHVQVARCVRPHFASRTRRTLAGTNK